MQRHGVPHWSSSGLRLAVVMVATAGIGGCGTRVVREASPSAPVLSPSGPAAPETVAPSAMDSTGATAVPQAPAAGTSLATAGRGTGVRPAENARAGSPSRVGVPGAHGSATQETAPNQVGEGASRSGGPGDANAAPAPPRLRSPVILASLGTQTGPVGAVLKPLVRGMQVWVADINARGGLNGHPVQVLVYDDGGDPARAKANAQYAIEQKGAIAFVANTDVLAGSASVDYITSKGIPMIGGDHGRTFGLKSPMFFPVTAVGPSMYRAAIVAPARYLVPRGAKKLGWLVCVETPVCKEADDLWRKEAPAAGWEPVYRGQVSVAQPDFTAECLAARQAGAKALLVILDPSGFERFARSCSRQNYRPALVGAAGVSQADRLKENPDLEGMVATGLTFPYFQTGTPATDEFRRAMRENAPGEVIEQTTSQGWASAKLMERAAAQLGEPPTTAALLKGLWSVNGETLGGLTGPLLFRERQLPDPKGCWWTYVIENRAWISPDSFTMHCL